MFAYNGEMTLVAPAGEAAGGVPPLKYDAAPEMCARCEPCERRCEADDAAGCSGDGGDANLVKALPPLFDVASDHLDERDCAARV